MIHKKIPGKDAITYSYNERDLLGAYQDGNLRDEGWWYVYNYDAYGREERQGFRNGALPPTTYDNLSLTETLLETDYGTASHEIDKVKEVRTKVMDGASQAKWLRTTNNYSLCGRLTSQTGNNHLNLAANEVTSYDYDGAGNVVASSYAHRQPSGHELIVAAEHNFDNVGRNIRNYFQVGNGGRKKINRIYYDDKGNVDRKHQGFYELPTGAGYLQKIDYTYLENGMLQGINIDGLTGGPGVALPGAYQEATNLNPTAPGTGDLDQKDLFYLELYRDQAPSVKE